MVLAVQKMYRKFKGYALNMYVVWSGEKPLLGWCKRSMTKQTEQTVHCSHVASLVTAVKMSFVLFIEIDSWTGTRL